ncbi:MAG: hypothetical protein PHQ12_10095, partial [Chthoniobacteraceae bacterium]|nr:hypothetical protein [Chthoniobacteraceae bacterium]
NAGFFRKLTAAIAARRGYDDTIWRYAVYHNDAPTLKEWLAHREIDCGPWFASALYNVDPVARRTYEHLEYSPLINPRAHRIGAEWRIGNPAFARQYRALMEILAHKPMLGDADNLQTVYYLFLQDRVEEALARLHAVSQERERAAKVRSGTPLPKDDLQFDYLRCYAAFYEQNLGEARAIVKQYADYPVDRWRKLFAEAASQLDAIEGAAAAASAAQPGEPDREAEQAALAAAEPAFEFKIESGTVALHWNNLPGVTVNYYRIDPEFAFSSAPFASQDASRFGIVKPAKTEQRALPNSAEGTEHWQLPEEFAKASVLVEILGAGARKTQACHANTLKLTVAENYGRLEVRASGDGKPVSAAYVKVYARLRNGTVRFFKDGYTDLRGKFDYASLNDSGTAAAKNVPAGGGGGLESQMLQPGELGQVERLALLIMSDTHGSEVREAAPPQ